MEQFLGSLVIHRFWSVVHHGIVTHQFEVRLKIRKYSKRYEGKPFTQTFKYHHHSNSLCIEKYRHLEFCNSVVLIVSNLVFHGAEVHRMLDDC